MPHNSVRREAALDFMDAIATATRNGTDVWGISFIGIEFARAYYSGFPWVSVSQLLERGVPLSKSQIRRRLQRLVDEGKLRQMRLGSVDLFATYEDYAKAVLLGMMSVGPYFEALQNDADMQL